MSFRGDAKASSPESRDSGAGAGAPSRNDDARSSLHRFTGGDDVDGDLHLHADKGVGRAEVSAMQRHRLARVARHRDTDEVAGADNAVGGIELDPAGARQIDLNPGMRRAAADIAMGAGAVDAQIARHEAR